MRILDRAACARMHARWRAGAALYVALALFAAAAPAHAQHEKIHSGAVELGIAGALTSIEGLTQRSILLHVGSFAGLPKGLFGFEGEIGHHHVQDLDRLDLLGTLSWVLLFPNSSVHPYAFASGGIREEWIGSFRQSRIPIGGGVGLRALTGSRAGARLDYRALRITDDPIKDYTEHQLSVGLSIFFRNPPAS